MIKNLSFAIIVLALTLGCSAEQGVSRPGDPRVQASSWTGVGQAEDIVAVEILATVKKLDRKKRFVTLLGPQGEELSFRVF